MKIIKKQQVTPIDPGATGQIVDSLSGSSTTNAPSINAVNNALSGKSNTGHTHTKSEITDFEHNHDDRYYTESESDAKYKLKGDFAIVTVNVPITIIGSDVNSGRKDVNYPTGFTKNNCVVISNAMAFGDIFTYFPANEVRADAKLMSDYIRITGFDYNQTTSTDDSLDIQIVLMKVS